MRLVRAWEMYLFLRPIEIEHPADTELIGTHAKFNLAEGVTLCLA